MALTREQILAQNDLKSETVSVPEWGDGAQVIVRTMSGTERDAYEISIIQSNGKDFEANRENARAKLLVQTIADETGNRLFTDEDVTELGKKSAAALDRIYTVSSRLNKLSKTDVEELAKN